MRDIDNDIRNSLERLTDPHDGTPGTDALWGALVSRRRKRRNRNRTLAALPLLLVAVLAVGLFAAQGSDDARSDVAAGGADAPSSDIDGSWRIAATVNNGERERATGTANLRFDGDQVQGSDGCNNPIDTTLENGVIVGPSIRTQVGCLGFRLTQEADLFWESLGHPLDVRDSELWLVNGQGDGMIFERVGGADETATGSLRVRNIQVFGNGPRAGGTERAVIVFNEPLPVEEVQYVADITSADPSAGMVWTAQGPDSTRVCDAVHSVPEGAVGSVDLFIPASWFADADAHTITELATTDDPAKFIVCGPHNGFIQYAVWGPLSADPGEVFVTVSPDRTTLNITFAGTVRSGNETGEPESEVEGNPLSFEPFTMRYRTTQEAGTEFVWTLDYTSVDDWSMELVSTTSSASGYEVGATQTFKDGKHTIKFGPNESAHVEEEERDEPVAPLQVLSRGPIGNFDTLYGQPAEPAVHAGRDGYETTEAIDCPEGNTDEVDWCGKPGGQVTLKTFYEFNSDGVPVLVHSYIEGTNPLVWRFEVLDYARKN